MIRKILTPDKQTITLDIPVEYVGREIEVIAFAVDEGLSEREPSPKKVTFDALSIDTRGFKFSRNELH
jgi:hypothetical protein